MLSDAEFQTRITALVRVVFDEDPGLAQSARRLDLDVETIVTETQARARAFRRAVTRELEQLFDAQSQFDAAASRRVDYEPRFGWLVTPTWVAIVCSTAAGLSLAISFFIGQPNSVVERLLRWWIPAPLVAMATILFLANRIVSWRNERRKETVATQNSALGTEALSAQLTAASQILDRAIIDRALRPMILQLRDQRDQIAYSTDLSYITARGLSQVYQADIFEVETPSLKRVREFLENTPGGSLGLAGPRGTGKTTVMSSFIEGRSRRSDDARGPAVQVSAPVEYEPRDFILYLFAELCQSVLVPSSGSGPMRREPADQLREGFGMHWYRAMPLLSLVLWILGIGLISSGLGWINVNSQIIWGSIALLLGALLYYVGIQEIWRNRRRREYRRYRAEMHERESLDASRAAQGREGVPEHVAQLAAEYLDAIRFQQTYTSGWSGSLKATVGVVDASGTLSGGTSNVRQALSMPEIGEMFKKFVTLLAEQGPVIIGIDELDKIDSADRAQAFLNDIKGIFGLDRCYFLISISEDALANFERRGLPIRDAFDSALDDVVRFEPLSYRTTLRLVRGRVVGLPEPFVALAYCLSGGLPRDVIRWTRAILEAQQIVGADDLETIAHRVIHMDIENKLSGTIAQLQKHASASSAVVVREISELALDADGSTLLNSYESFMTVRGVPRSALKAPAAGDISIEADRVVDAFFIYLYFCSVLLSTFSADMSEEAFQTFICDAAAGTVNELVHARSLFTVDPWLAARKIDSFRRAFRP